MDSSFNSQPEQPFSPPNASAGQRDAPILWRVLKRRKWLIFLGLLVGIAIGNVLYSNAETVYESSAMVRIDQKSHFTIGMTTSGDLHPEFIDLKIRHDRLIHQENVISETIQTFETNQPSGGLPSLQDFTNAEKIEYISENLYVEQDREESTVFIATLLNSNEDDGQKIIEGLLATYKKNLEDAEADDGDEGFYFQTLREPRLGKVVWPLLPFLLITGGMLGMLGGFVLGCMIEAVAK